MGDTPTKINEALAADAGLEEGIAILAKAEWFQLQAFCDMAVYTNPTTEDSMRVTLKLPKDAALNQDFKDTLKLFVDLKGYCTTFQNEIKPGTVDLASDIVQYARRAQVIYPKLNGLLADYQLDGKVNEIKLKALVNDWGSDNPTEKGKAIKEDFKKYIGRLKTEADARSTKAGALQTKLTTFRDNLKQSGTDFSLHYTAYKKKYGDAEKELLKLKGDLQDLSKELDDARKKERDETIVLGTSPLYLLIPFVGPFIMAGVLLGVGVDFGLLREKIKTKIREAEEKQKKADTEQTFFAAYTQAKDWTGKTAEDIKAVLPLVDKLKSAWDAFSRDLKDLSDVMSSAQGTGLTEEWDFASIDLQTGLQTWLDLKEQADQYRRFADCKKVDTVDQLAEGMRKAA
ncbi:MAG TPA: alpha-xenorhabdolysin family binary toxin subunit A [Pyrinomonadaceae bacterium]|nr:alpha-xenorhabdolysin family binary toxin subunit A [Pyrinomonadaceae bacterium]